MSFFIARFYDSCMARAEAICLRQWRRELLSSVAGTVLEIGSGTGANIDCYPSEVESLVLAEPDPCMRRKLADKIAGTTGLHAVVCAGSAEDIEAKDASFDFVVASLVCCSVSDLDAALMEIMRVLKPGGSLVFLEHVAAAKGGKTRRWQNWLTPVWRRVAGNCHLNRETETAIIAAGLQIREIKRENFPGRLPLVMPTIRGIAVKV